MRRYRFRKSLAVVLTVAFMAAIHLALSAVLVEAAFHMREKLPLYEEHIRTLHERLAGFLTAHGILSAHVSPGSLFSSGRIIELVQLALPTAITLVSDRFLIWLLSVIFLIEMANPEGARTGRLARNLAYYGGDVQRFIAIFAKTGAINALANLVLLMALGVDFPISLIPPTLVALLMSGWKRALLVLGALILTEMLGDYVVKPMLMIKGLNVSLLQIMLSLIVWGFLLGPAGAILAIPLTLALRKYIESPLLEAEPAATPAPG
jgi:predicted PurR-regulated permease PerM